MNEWIDEWMNEFFRIYQELGFVTCCKANRCLGLAKRGEGPSW